MAAIAAVLALALTAINIALALRTAWKEWKQRKEKPHPLDAALRDIAAAMREHHEALQARDVTIRQLQTSLRQTEEARRRYAFE